MPSLSLVFPVKNGIAKKTFKNNEIKKNKHNKTVLIARSKVNSIESIISKDLKYEIIHEGFTTIINEAENYHKLKESIRMMKVIWKRIN